jgi:FixJ family two-component response regulator
MCQRPKSDLPTIPNLVESTSTEMDVDQPVVYIVDDDASVRRALKRLARAAGFEPRTFASGGEFLAAVTSERPACVLLDLRLPDMHGLQVQRRLAKTNPGIGVIVITGYGDDLTRHEALNAGAIVCLSKPFDDQVLLEAMKKALDGP